MYLDWRCILYWKWGFSIAMLVQRSVILDKLLSFKTWIVRAFWGSGFPKKKPADVLEFRWLVAMQIAQNGWSIGKCCSFNCKGTSLSDDGRILPTWSITTLIIEVVPELELEFLNMLKGYLVGGFLPNWRTCSSNWISSPNQGENQRYLKPPPSYIF